MCFGPSLQGSLCEERPKLPRAGPSVGRGVGSEGTKVGVGRRGEERWCFTACLLFPPSEIINFFIGIGNKLNEFSPCNPVLPVIVIGKWHFRLFLSLGAFPCFFLPLFLLKVAEREQLVGLLVAGQAQTTTG